MFPSTFGKLKLLGITIGVDQLDSYSGGVIWGVEVVNAVKSQGHAVPHGSQLVLTSGEFCVDLSAQLGTSFTPFTGTYFRQRGVVFGALCTGTGP